MKLDKQKSSKIMIGNITASLKRGSSNSKHIHSSTLPQDKVQKPARQKSSFEGSVSRKQVNNTTNNVMNSDSLTQTQVEGEPHYNNLKKKLLKGIKRREKTIETPQLSFRNHQTHAQLTKPSQIQIVSEIRASSITVNKPRTTCKILTNDFSEVQKDKIVCRPAPFFPLKAPESNIMKEKFKKTISKSVGKIACGAMLPNQHRMQGQLGSKDISHDLTKTKGSALFISDFKKIQQVKSETAASSRRSKKQIAFKNNTKKSIIEQEKPQQGQRHCSPRAVSKPRPRLKISAGGKNDMKFIKEKLELLMQKIDGLNVRRASPNRPSGFTNTSISTNRAIFINNFIPDGQKSKQPTTFKKMDTTKTRKARQEVQSRAFSPEKPLESLETLKRFAREIRTISPSFQNNLEQLPMNQLHHPYDIDELFDQCKRILDKKLKEALKQLQKESVYSQGDPQVQKVRFESIQKAKRLYQRQLEGLEKTRSKMKTDIKQFEIILKNKDISPNLNLTQKIEMNTQNEIDEDDENMQESARGKSKLRTLIQTHIHSTNPKFSKKLELNFNSRFSLEKLELSTPFNYKESLGGGNNSSVIMSRGKQIISDPDLINLKLESASKLFRHNLKTNNSALSDNSSVKSIIVDTQKGNSYNESTTPVNACLEKSTKINPRHFNFQFQDSNVLPKHTKSQLSAAEIIFESGNLVSGLLSTIIQEEIVFYQLQTKKKQNQKRKTSLFISADQIEKFCRRAMKYFLKNQKEGVLDQLNTDYGSNVLQKLSEFSQGIEYDLSIVNEYNSKPVIDKNFINQFFFNYKFHEKEQNLIQIEKSNDKMLFDCLNEALCSWRPYAFRGSQMPWRPAFGCAYKVIIRPEDIFTITEISINKIREWSMLGCGMLNEKYGSSAEPFQDLKDEEIELHREDRLTKFLNWETYETDERWLWYENEAIEAMIETEQSIWEDLVMDLAQFLNNY
jgi:hypothetical protein